MTKLNPEMTIKEWVDRDIDRAAWEIIAFALVMVKSGFYQKNGVPILHQTTRDFLNEYGHTPPEWIIEIHSVLESHQKEDYEWPVLPKSPYA